MQPKLISVSRPDLGPHETDAVARVLQSQWVGMGPVTVAFEQRLQTFLGVPQVVATASGTAAQLAPRAEQVAHRNRNKPGHISRLINSLAGDVAEHAVERVRASFLNGYQ